MDLYKFEKKVINVSEALPLHKQDTWEITYVVNGRGVRTLGDKQSEFVEGDIVFIPPHIPHHWEFDSEYTENNENIEYLTLSFKTEYIDRCSSAFPEITERLEELKSVAAALTFPEKEAAVLADMMTKMSNDAPSELLPYVFRLVLLLSKYCKKATVAGTYSETNRTSDRINRVKDFSQSNYARTITIDMVAEHVGMNRSSFCTFFKKATGQTYITYLNKLRVDRACYLLREGNFNITEVCYMVGFNDVPYFNRCFKNNRGMSPKEYAEGIVTQRQMMKQKKQQ